MINLLPPAVKTDVAYAKRNAMVVKFVIVIIIVAVLLSLLMVGGVFYANTRANQLQEQLSTRQQQIKRLEPVRKEATSISQTVTTIDNLLDQQSYYSHFIAELGQTVPSWATITSLTLDRQQNNASDPTNGKRIDLQMLLNDIERVGELRTILQNMERVDFVDIQQAQENEAGVTALIVLGLNTPAHQPLDDGGGQ